MKSYRIESGPSGLVSLYFYLSLFGCLLNGQLVLIRCFCFVVGLVSSMVCQ